MSASSLPNTCYCPITMLPMVDPVMGPDRQTYERSAIEQWLDTHCVSPVTRQVMMKTQLIPNIALREVIEEYMKMAQSTSTNSSPPVVQKYDEQCHLISYVSKIDETTSLIHLKVTPPIEGQRKASAFILEIDVSGSMGEPVSNGEEEHGFSRLDLVKHAMRTMISVLNENDYLAVVVFTTSARVVLNFTQMNESGRNIANLTVDALRPEANTNIWDGLMKGIDLIDNPICKDRNVYSVLLTDGLPNVNPPRGIVPSLERYIKEKPFKGTISTFGFGYQVDSVLLDDIATKTNGCYAFIPDATMVGTVFVNYISNCLSGMYDKLNLGINTNCEVVEKYGSTELGMMQYGQPRDVLFKVKTTPGGYFKVQMEGREIEVDITSPTDTMDNETRVQLSRIHLIKNLSEACQRNFSLGQNSVVEILANLKANETDTRVVEMIKDFYSSNPNQGQITKAFSRKDWFDKWGRHHIPSYIKAQVNQQCINFKDPGVQIYGGKLFEKIRDVTDDIFCKLPAPTPSLAVRQYNSNSTSITPSAYTQPASQPVSMATYYDYSGGCFGGNSDVHMANGKMKKVKDVKKGDVIYGGSVTKSHNLNSKNSGAKVLCVVKTKVTRGEKPMVQVNGLEITNWHPIRLKGEWVFPVNVFGSRIMKIDTVYNFVLDKGHVMMINHIECSTLGHGFTENNVISHPYYGTNKIINDLKKMTGWDQGLIEVSDNLYVRNGDSVTSIMQV